MDSYKVLIAGLGLLIVVLLVLKASVYILGFLLLFASLAACAYAYFIMLKRVCDSQTPNGCTSESSLLKENMLGTEGKIKKECAAGACVGVLIMVFLLVTGNVYILTFLLQLASLAACGYAYYKMHSGEDNSLTPNSLVLHIDSTTENLLLKEDMLNTEGNTKGKCRIKAERRVDGKVLGPDLSCQDSCLCPDKGFKNCKGSSNDSAPDFSEHFLNLSSSEINKTHVKFHGDKNVNGRSDLLPKTTNQKRMSKKNMNKQTSKFSKKIRTFKHRTLQLVKPLSKNNAISSAVNNILEPNNNSFKSCTPLNETNTSDMNLTINKITSFTIGDGITIGDGNKEKPITRLERKTDPGVVLTSESNESARSNTILCSLLFISKRKKSQTRFHIWTLFRLFACCSKKHK